MSRGLRPRSLWWLPLCTSAAVRIIVSTISDAQEECLPALEKRFSELYHPVPAAEGTAKDVKKEGEEGSNGGKDDGWQKQFFKVNPLQAEDGEEVLGALLQRAGRRLTPAQQQHVLSQFMAKGLGRYIYPHILIHSTEGVSIFPIYIYIFLFDKPLVS